MTLPTPSFETSFFDLPIRLKVFLREIGLGEEEKQVTQRSVEYKVWLPSSKDEEVPF